MQFMNEAIGLARKAQSEDEIPVGAVVVKDGKVIARSYNQIKNSFNPIGHAELLAMQAAGKALGSQMLYDCDLYVTLEPCPMCAAAASLARIRTIYFGAYDLKSGGIAGPNSVLNSPSCHYKPEWYGGIQEEECGELMKNFFKEKR